MHPKTEDYRARAAQCAALAEAAPDPRFREVFITLQQSWSRLARGVGTSQANEQPDPAQSDSAD